MKTAIALLFVVLASAIHVEANLCNCRLPVFPKVVNGRNASVPIPWLVQIRAGSFYDYRTQKNICSGIIVKEQWVATAASCIHQQNVANLFVIAGQQNVTNIQSGSMSKVNFFKEHPDFDAFHLENGSDIALLQLQEPLKLETRKIELACLDLNFEKPTANQPLLFTGFGIWNETGLNQTELARYSYFETTNSAPAANIISAKAMKGHGQICDSDEGGPLHAVTNGLNKVVGLASYNVGPSDDTKNTIVYCTPEAHFTRLASVKAFIEKTIGAGHC